MTPLQLALRLKDTFSAKMLIKAGAQVLYTQKDRIIVSPLFYMVKVQNVTALEAVLNKYPDLIQSTRWPLENLTFIQYAAKHNLNELVTYLSVICKREEIDEEDHHGFNPLLYYLMRNDYEVCTKLIFRGANVNHIYKAHGGKTAVALMILNKNEIAVKYLLDKLANPHICFPAVNPSTNETEWLDACDLARARGLDNRFFVFLKCKGDHKVVPDDHDGVKMKDLQKQVKEVDIAAEYDSIMEENLREDEDEHDLGWITQELKVNKDDMIYMPPNAIKTQT